MHTTRRHNQRLPKVDRSPSSILPLPSKPATNAKNPVNYRKSSSNRDDAKTVWSTPPPSTLPPPSGPTSKRNNDNSTRKQATRNHKRQQQRRQQKRQQPSKQKQQWKHQDKPKLRTIFENRKAVMQFKAKKKSQRLQQQQESQQHQRLKLVHQELLQRATSQQHYHQQILLLNIRLLETKLKFDKNDRMLQARNDRLSHLAQQDKDAFNTLDNNVINKLVLQLCATLKTTQPAPTQTQQLRWKYGFVLHQMLTTTAHKAHRDMLQSVHNELTTNTPIIDAIHLRPSNNTVTSFHRQPSPTNILRCLLPTSFGFTHCNNCYYFHKLRPPDNITPAKQHLTNPFDTLYFFSKARPPDDDNNVVQQQHFNSFGNSYFFSKVRPPELTLHV